ncbi:LamG domain-containing protein [Glycomyces sp. YM15]|uniref:LamG domain-containing protein n=1 Tax=Glycomyces sp. YM15 TaxID=2800446 RepID=UPI001963FFDB|nr:LamG domain-containing protein [Glycomyces sp. YM15]
MVGEIGAFNITTADADIESYLVDFMKDDKGRIKVVLDSLSAPLELSYMPITEGSDVLTVRAINTAGEAKEATYIFSVSAKDPVGAWALDEPAGSSAVMEANGDNLGTVLPGVTLGVDGPGGATAATFDGSKHAYIDTADKGLLRSDEGFAVSAWVRIADLSRDQVAVSLADKEESGFALGYRSLSASSGEWSFWTTDAESAPSAEWRVSGGSVRAGTSDEWVHLVGVYNQVDQSMSLYVNGTAVGSTVRGTVWNATCDVQIGRARAAGEWSMQWNGDIAEAKVFDRYVAAGEAAAIGVHRLFQRQGYWQFSSAPEALSPEYTGGQDVRLHGDAAILVEEDPFFGPFPISGAGHLLLDGDGDFAALGTVPVDTSGSFSMTALVLPAQLSQDMTVFSISGEHRPLAEVRYDAADGAWELVLAKSDSSDAETVSVTSPRSPDTWSAQGIAVVFDGALGEWTLYVGGSQNGVSISDEEIESWTATSGIEIGRTSADDAGTAYFNGGIDEFRVYSGAISDYYLNALSMAGTEMPNL